jgi:hypothetical protein
VSARSGVRSLRTAVAIVASTILPAAGLAAGATSAAAATSTACPSWSLVPSHSPSGSSLNAVAATSARNAWAVGTRDVGGAYQTLIERWNGRNWSVARSPSPAKGSHTTNALAAVVALSSRDAWAFGWYEKRSASFRTLIEHWNGSTWSVVRSPNSGTGENALSAAAARSPKDIWVVGYHNDPGRRRTLTEHWDGHSWSIVPSPSVGSGDSFLFGVATSVAGPVWAVGTSPRSFNRTLAMTWADSAWSLTPTVDPGDGDRFLQAVAAPAPGSALAVGSYLSGTRTRALAERWSGSAWSVVPVASPGAYYNSLQAVAATSGTSAWAVGASSRRPGGQFRAIAEHWNGASWTRRPIPSPGHGDDWLYGIAAVPHGPGFWAVGVAGNHALTEFRC